MRLTKSMRDMVARKVAEEKVKKAKDSIEERIKKEADLFVKSLIPKEFYTCWKQLDKDRRFISSTNMIHIPGYGDVEVEQFPLPKDWYIVKQKGNSKKLNEAISDYKKMMELFWQIRNEVRIFLGQFTTYKKLQAEWPDISRYLSETGSMSVKKPQTALIKTGKELNKFLQNF